MAFKKTMSIHNFIIKFFEKIINFILQKLNIKLKLSDLLRIAAVKVTQFENIGNKITSAKTCEVQGLCSHDGCLPSAFDISIYRELNSDLSQLGDGELKVHYFNMGAKEGKACSKIRSRKDFIDVIENFKGERLEIGPFCSPILKKRPETYFSDYFNTEELRVEAVNQKQDPNNVPTINFPTKELSLCTAVGDKRFSVVVSCHNIEHYPDLVTHLQEVSAVLIKGGYYFLIIPDKRFSAYYYQETSTLPEVLAAYAEKRKLPNIENVLKSTDFITHSYPQRHWMNDHGADPYRVLSKVGLLASLRSIAKSVQKMEYNDMHCWRFTPQSFGEIIFDLNEMKLVDLKAVRIFPTLFGAS